MDFKESQISELLERANLLEAQALERPVNVNVSPQDLPAAKAIVKTQVQDELRARDEIILRLQVRHSCL